MSSSGNSCAACGQKEFEIVDCQKVCTNCGVLTKYDCSLVSDNPAELGPSSTEYRSYSRSLPTRYAVRNDPTRRYFQEGYRRLKELSSVLHLTEDMVGEARHLVERIVNHPDVLKMRVEHKLHATAACIYIVCLRRRWPMSVNHIAGISGYPAADIIRFKKIIIQEYELSVDHLGVEEIIKPMIADFGLSDACCRLAEDIVFLCKDTWLTNGRNPVCIVHAAIFLAWKSEVFLERYKTKYTEFTKRHKIKPSKTVGQRKREMIDVLIKLAKQLPYVEKDKILNEKTVIEFIPDVCRYRKLMMQKALAEAETSSDDNIDSNDLKTTTTVCVQSEAKDQNTRKRKNDFNPPCFKRACGSSTVDENNSNVGQVDYKGDLNAEELCELDIPESQLDHYIKSDQEVKAETTIRSFSREISNV